MCMFVWVLVLDPKKVCVGISILGGGSIEIFDLDDEQSKRKVNGSNRSQQNPRGESKGKLSQQVAIYYTWGLRCEKVSSYLLNKGLFVF